MLLDPLNSIAKFPFYKGVPGRSGLRISLYILYLGLLFSITATTALVLRLGPLIRESAEWAAATVPPITFVNGKVSMEQTAPRRFQHPSIPGFAFIVDTTRTTPVTLQEMEDQKVVAWLAQSTLFLREAANSVKAEDLSKAAAPKPLVIDKNFYLELGSLVPKILYPVSFVTTWGVFFFWKLASAALYGLIGLLISGVLAAGLEYPDLFKLAVYAQTPVILLQALQLFLPKPIPFFWVIGFLVASVWLWQAVKQNSKQTAGGAAA